MTAGYSLQRFIEAQDRGYGSVLGELESGHKRSHWMWYIFPQIQGLGISELSQMYAISSQAEAKAYLDHPILGSRLRECTRLVMGVEGRAIKQIFYPPDDLKFCSCMTLFATVAVDPSIFFDAIRKYFHGKQDQLTLDILKAMTKI